MGEQHVSTEESALLMSPRVIYGHPGPRLECIHRGEVQGTLTEYSSSAWRIGDVVGYAPMEKPRKVFNAKSFFTDWSGFTWYVLGPLLRVAFWVALFIAPVSPMFLLQGPLGISEEMGEVLLYVLVLFLYFPPLILAVGCVAIWLLFLSIGKFLNAVGDAVESTRLLIGQHKSQQDFQFRLVYECTPITVSSPATLLHRTTQEES